MKYTTCPKSAYLEDDLYDYSRSDTPPLEVWDSKYVDTGLLDASGNVIWKAPNKIGFGRGDF